MSNKLQIEKITCETKIRKAEKILKKKFFSLGNGKYAHGVAEVPFNSYSFWIKGNENGAIFFDFYYDVVQDKQGNMSFDKYLALKVRDIFKGDLKFIDFDNEIEIRTFDDCDGCGSYEGHEHLRMYNSIKYNNCCSLQIRIS